MFKLPNLPSPQAEPNELADFAELLAWQRDSVSAREIVAYLGRLDENDDNIGCDDNDDKNANELDEVMNEIERRAMACGTGYPFKLDLQGTVLRHSTDDDSVRAQVYRYLLLSTRLNMSTCRVHGGIDGANLLEEIAAEVMRHQLGSKRARSIVFGTAAQGRFEDKVNQLCRDLGEGGSFRSLDSGPVDANDDKLDTVTWVPFSDKYPGQVIVFGQCKTGSNWQGLTTQLQPEAFIKRWMSEMYMMNPLRALFISEAANRSRWRGYSLYAGLLLDRCRLVDFCDGLNSELLGRVRTWCRVARGTVTI